MTLRDINLVPAEFLYHREAGRCLARWAVILVAGLAVIFGVHGYQTRVVLAKMRPTTTLSDMHTRLGATLEEITDTQTEIQRLSLQQSILQELTLHHPFTDLLQLLAGAMNPQTWLTHLEIKAGEDKQALNGMRLQGYAVSNELLADLLTHLSTAKLVDGVVLKFAKDAQVAGLTEHPDQLVAAVHFEIDCRLKEPNL